MKDLEGLGYEDRVSCTNYSLKIVMIVSHPKAKHIVLMLNEMSSLSQN